MNEAGSKLMSMVDTTLVTREQLAALPPVVSTDTFKAIPHIELIESLDKALGKRQIKIKKEQYAIRHDGSRLFGTLDLITENDLGGTCASLGIRTANDKTMALQMVAGMRIFVCDNLAFNGDMIALRRKHTSGLNLAFELEGALRRYERHYLNLVSGVEVLKEKLLNDEQAKAIMWDAFVKYRVMPNRREYTEAVAKEYFEPSHPDFEPRTAWSLHNAFTEAIKQIKSKDGLSSLPNQMLASQAVGKVFGLFGQKA